jgi:NodT family efflux transporter outer membrane factor (OMF) lipoprotein
VTVRRRLASFAALPGLVLVASCAGTSGPDYSRPDFELPAAMPLAKPSQSGSPRADWWTSFGDAELDSLVDQARKGNADLRTMEARIRSARAAARRAGAPAAPRLDVGGTYARARPSENSISDSAKRFTDAGDPTDVYTTSFDMSWEPDLFGRVRRGVEAAWADAAAVEEDRRAMEVALVADVAQSWFDLGEADAQAAILAETADLLRRTLDIVRTRLDAGLVSEVDLRRTEADLSVAVSRIPEAERRRAVAENRLALLLGKPPGLRPKGRAPASFDVPAEIPVGIPAQLLERRPDVRAAERRLVATNARVGEAIADFYPRVTIVGRAGYSSISGDELARWGSRIWSITPSVSLPLLDGGEREYRLLESEAQRDAATSEWHASILRALNEVGDAMVSIDARKRTREAARETVTANQRSVELATVRYSEGITSFLEVLDAQRAYALTRLDLLRAERDLLADVVRLHQALGGGWEGEERADEMSPSEPSADASR